MPRKGHKEGCQCSVCKKMGKKATPAVEQAGAITVGSIQLGKFFEFKGIAYKKMGYIGDKVKGWCGPTWSDGTMFNPSTLVIPK